MPTAEPPADDARDGVFRVGGITYLHIPAAEPPRAADFYAAVFGWSLHGDLDRPSFEDGTGHVIGAWVSDRPPAARASGVLPYVYVEQVAETLARVGANGGSPGKSPYPEGDLTVATFIDPAGNEIGIWQRG